MSGSYRYRVPFGSFAHMALYKMTGDAGKHTAFGVEFRVTDFEMDCAKRTNPRIQVALRPYRVAQEWESCRFGPGSLEAFEYRPGRKERYVGRGNKARLYTFEVRGYYTVYTPYGETTVYVETEIDAESQQTAPTFEQVHEAVDWWLDEHRDEWEDADDFEDDFTEEGEGCGLQPAAI